MHHLDTLQYYRLILLTQEQTHPGADTKVPELLNRVKLDVFMAQE